MTHLAENHEAKCQTEKQGRNGENGSLQVYAASPSRSSLPPPAATSLFGFVTFQTHPHPHLQLLRQIKMSLNRWYEITSVGRGDKKKKRWQRRARKVPHTSQATQKHTQHVKYCKDTGKLFYTVWSSALSVCFFFFLGHTTHFKMQQNNLFCFLNPWSQAKFTHFQGDSFGRGLKRQKRKHSSAAGSHPVILIHVTQNHSIIPQIIFICSFVIFNCGGLIWPT